MWNEHLLSQIDLYFNKVALSNKVKQYLGWPLAEVIQEKMQASEPMTTYVNMSINLTKGSILWQTCSRLHFPHFLSHL